MASVITLQKIRQLDLQSKPFTHVSIGKENLSKKLSVVHRMQIKITRFRCNKVCSILCCLGQKLGQTHFWEKTHYAVRKD